MIGFKPRYDSLLELKERDWVEWWLVFTSTDFGHWWNRYLAPGFLHVSALRISRDRWIRVEPAMDYCRVETVDAPVYASARDLALPGAKILRVHSFIQVERMRAPWVVGPVTCVETMKALLGIRSFLLWTPKQLHDYVLARRCRLGADDEKPQEAERIRRGARAARTPSAGPGQDPGEREPNAQDDSVRALGNQAAAIRRRYGNPR